MMIFLLKIRVAMEEIERHSSSDDVALNFV